MEKEKDVLCSFVGSNTHTCREKLKACMSGKKDVVFKMGKWDFSFPREKVRNFYNIIHTDETVKDDLMPFFKELEKVGAEFGYRTASEISRFVKVCTDMGEGVIDRDEVIDAAIIQKLLPKLHGSRKKLETIIEALNFDSLYLFPNSWV